MSSNQFVIINPGVEHVESTLPQTSVEWIVIGIKGCGMVLPNTADGCFSADFQGDNGATVNLLVSLVHELQNKAHGYQEACLHILQLLMIYVGRASGTDITIGSQTPPSPTAASLG